MYSFKLSRGLCLLLTACMALVLAGCPDSKTVAIPDVTGMPQLAAQLALTGGGLSVGTVSQQESDTVPAGNVISQSPAAGLSVAQGTPVNLVVASASSSVSVPNVVGLSQAGASTSLSGAGLCTGSVTKLFSSTVPYGFVISQSPSSGSAVASGCAVDLVVSKGPTSVVVPNTVGLTQSAATDALMAVGLPVSTVARQSSRTVPAGTVISQAPGAGTTVPANSVVDLVVSSGPASVTVPNVAGFTQSVAASLLSLMGLTEGDISEQFSGTIAAGKVISQDPAANTRALAGDAVDLVLSKGPAPLSVPDVVGLARATAESTLTSAGLAIGAVTEEYSAAVPEGDVIRQYPVAGADAAPGDLVNLAISGGTAPVTVPNVMGLTQAAAEYALTFSGLVLGTVTEAYSDTIAATRVMGQDPLKDTSVASGSAVNLILSKGPEPVIVPNIVGLARAAAESAITGTKLRVGSATLQFNDTVPEDHIISQDPAAGTSILPNSPVDFVVSLGPEPVLVPDVTGISQTEAEAALVAGELVLGSVWGEYSETIPVGEVISQNPVAGASVVPGTPINLTVCLGPAPKYVVINEFVASNNEGLTDEDGDEEDWIELYNPDDIAVNLQGWSLTDDDQEPRKWVFPNVTIGPGAYLVVFASDKDRAVAGSELHTNFKLSAGGEYLALFNSDDPALATSEFTPEYPEQLTDYSYGCHGSGPAFWYFGEPTPGAVNAGTAYEGLVGDLTVSPPHGFYYTAQSVTLSTNKADATIRYTLDGTEPTLTNGAKYESPISVTANAVLRARAFAPYHLPSGIETHTYLVNLPSAQQARPVISIVADPAQSLYEPNGIMAIEGGEYIHGGYFNVDGQEIELAPKWRAVNSGDYNNPMGHGDLYERPTSVELIYPADNSGFQANCGIRVHGSDFHRRRYRRDPGADWTLPGINALGVYAASYNKFSLRLAFRGDYGLKKLEYPLFADGFIQEFDQLVCRGGHNDGYNPFIHDELIRRLGWDTGQIHSRGIIVNLFINGEYKGYYNLVERLDEDFFQKHFDSDEEWDVLSQSGARDGDETAFWQLLSYALNNDLSQSSRYQAICGMMDMHSFIDYLLVELYAANEDWPSNNWTVARERSSAGKFYFLLWDAEASFRPNNLTRVGFEYFPFGSSVPGTGLNGENCPLGTLYRNLKVNADFRARFSTRAHQHFEPTGGALGKENVAARHAELRAAMLPMRPDYNNFIETNWVPNREAVIIQALRDEGLYVDD